MKINVLSGLLRDRKNKFLFVGEGNFSFTVAFNAYRQSLLSTMHSNIFNDKDHPHSKIMSILLLLFQLTSSITDEAVKRVCDLLQGLQHQCMVPKSVHSVDECLRENLMYLQLLRDNKCLTNAKMIVV